MKFRHTVLLLFLTVSFSFAQEWQHIGLDSLSFTPANEIILKSAQGFGLAYRKNPPPDYPKRYWIQGDYWLEESSAKPDAYFVFGHAVKDTVQLWAGGYSLVEKRIRFGRIHFSGNGEIYFEDLMQKPVEILNKEDKYVFRFIFHHQTGEIRLDVNGVPMRCELPISSHKITHLGYMVKNGKVCFKAMEFDGD